MDGVSPSSILVNVAAMMSCGVLQASNPRKSRYDQRRFPTARSLQRNNQNKINLFPTPAQGTKKTSVADTTPARVLNRLTHHRPADDASAPPTGPSDSRA